MVTDKTIMLPKLGSGMETSCAWAAAIMLASSDSPRIWDKIAHAAARVVRSHFGLILHTQENSGERDKQSSVRPSRTWRRMRAGCGSEVAGLKSFPTPRVRLQIRHL